MKKKKGVMQSTFQTRLVVKGAEKEFLSVWAAEYARIQRCLFQQLYPRKSGSLPHNKPAFMGTHDLSSRQYNAVRRDLDGKTRSYLSNLDNRIIQAEIQVKAAAAKIDASVKKLEKLSAKTDPGSRSRTSIIKKALFQKRRRRARLNTKLADLNQIKAAGRHTG